jgi:hypothetical protein
MAEIKQVQKKVEGPSMIVKVKKAGGNFKEVLNTKKEAKK